MRIALAARCFITTPGGRYGYWPRHCQLGQNPHTNTQKAYQMLLQLCVSVCAETGSHGPDTKAGGRTIASFGAFQFPHSWHLSRIACIVFAPGWALAHRVDETNSCRCLLWAFEWGFRHILAIFQAYPVDDRPRFVTEQSVPPLDQQQHCQYFIMIANT